MHALSSFLAVVALTLTVVFIPIVGGVLFAIVFFGLFLLALIGVLAGADDRTVRERNPTGWRNGPSTHEDGR